MTGRVFSRPFESPYNQYRRYLIANPGLTQQRRDAALKLAFPNLRTRIERVLALEPRNTSWPQLRTQHSGYQRQCPYCAREIFHTTFYNYKWLTLCPIHNSQFSHRCPECGEVWPSLRELSARLCHCCGCPPLSKIQRCSTISSGDTYWGFNDINKLFYKRPYIAVFDDCLSYSHTYPPSETKFIFPSLQSRALSETDITNLTSRHVHIEPVHSKISEPLIAKEHNSRKVEYNYEYAKHGYLPYSVRLDEEFNVMEYIVSWINKSMPSNHVITISNWFNYSVHQLFEKSCPCVFCMALSIWFFHIFTKNERVHYQYGVKDWMFFEGLYFDDFFVLGNRIHAEELNLNHIENNQKDQIVFYLGSNMEKWIYRRSLEIFYKRLFCFIQNIVVRACSLHHKAKPSLYDFEDIQSSYEGLEFNLTRQANRFIALYQYEHPIDTVSVHKELIGYNSLHSTKSWNKSWPIELFSFNKYLFIREEIKRASERT